MGANKVFEGEVLSVEKSDEYKIKGIFKVTKAWKGLKKDRIEIYSSTSSCGIEFITGATYTLWVNGNETNSCDNHIKNETEFLRDKPTLKLEKSDPEKSKTDELKKSEPGELEIEKARENFLFNLLLLVFVLIAFLGFALIILGIFLFGLKRKK